MFVIIVSFFLRCISQGGVETHLRCDRIYNNRIIASCP